MSFQNFLLLGKNVFFICKLYSAGMIEHQKNVDDEFSIEYSVEESTSTIQQNWVPDCPDEYKLQIGQCFDTIDDAFKYYEQYAMICGFSARRSTGDKSKSLKYFLCNKEGYARPYSKNMTPTRGRRVTKTTRCGCYARLCLKHGGNDKYYVYKFIEGHNHSLASENGKQYLKSNRKLTYAQQNLIMHCGNANVGPSKVHKIMKEMTGGYANIGATLTEIKNFRRDMKIHIKGADAQIVVDNFKNKKECCEDFFFEFYTNEEGNLERLFWADKIARIDCIEFGDVMSFDATYSTNK